MNDDLIKEQLEFLQSLPSRTDQQEEWCAWARERLAGDQAEPATPAAEPAPLPKPLITIDEWACQQAAAWKDVGDACGPGLFVPWMTLWLWLRTTDCKEISNAIRSVPGVTFPQSYHLLRDVRRIASNGLENRILTPEQHVRAYWFDLEDGCGRDLSMVLDLMTLDGTLTRSEEYDPEKGYAYALKHP